jgi:hypothetical protein
MLKRMLQVNAVSHVVTQIDARHRVKVLHQDEAGQAKFERELVSMDHPLWTGEMFFPSSEKDAPERLSSVFCLLRPGAHSPLEPE